MKTISVPDIDEFREVIREELAHALAGLHAGMKTTDPDELLTTKQVASIRGCSTATLEKEREGGTGVRYLQKTPRASVRYRRRDVEAWLASGEKLSTSQQPAPPKSKRLPGGSS